jgi:hypothetical protein
LQGALAVRGDGILPNAEAHGGCRKGPTLEIDGPHDLPLSFGEFGEEAIKMIRFLFRDNLTALGCCRAIFVPRLVGGFGYVPVQRGHQALPLFPPIGT